MKMFTTQLATKLQQFIYRYSPGRYFDQLAQHWTQVGVALERDRTNARKKEWENATCDALVGKPVICVLGGNRDLMVGYCTGNMELSKANNRFPVVRDYVHNKESVVFGQVFVFTRQRFDALLKLTPEQRWCLFNQSGTINDNDDEVDFERTGSNLLTNEAIVARLVANGFFSRLIDGTLRATEIQAP